MLGDRLRLARKKAGLSLRDLASRLDPAVSAQALSKYEANEMMPSSRVLVGLGKSLGVSLDFLMSGQVAELAGVDFRKHSGTSARDHAQVEAIVIEKLEDYLAVEDILELPQGEDSFASVRGAVSSLEESEQRAKALRDAWNLGEDAIPSMTGLLEDKGFKVIEVDLPERVHGLTCDAHRPGGLPPVSVIVVSSRVNIERKRFTLAHELGHRVISDVIGDVVGKEKAINRFAGAFLIPEPHLRAEIGGGRHNVAYGEIRLLKHLYGVSAGAVLMRLGQTGLLPEHVITYAFRTYANGWRKSEPDEIPANGGLAALERPRRFEALVYQALAEDLISPVRAAGLLKVSLSDVERGLRGPQP
jgi:Zn-dependent peptidase ImmA (M78 family)/transcriptional regulator with XRE-family HTH domain